MKNLLPLLMSVTLLLSGCGSMRPPSLEGNAGSSATATENGPTSSSESAEVELTQQGDAYCSPLAHWPSYGAGAIRASGGVICTGFVTNINADAMLRIFKTDRYGTPVSPTPVGSKVVNFNVRLVGGTTPLALKTSGKCVDGLYAAEVGIFFTNAATQTLNPSKTPAIHIACKEGVNQVEYPILDVVTAIADHAWNGTNGGTGHSADFMSPNPRATNIPTGIRSQAQLQEYLFNIITGRYTVHRERVDILDRCVDGRIAMFDRTKSVFIIYNPKARDYGSAYPALRTAFKC